LKNIASTFVSSIAMIDIIFGSLTKINTMKKIMLYLLLLTISNSCKKNDETKTYQGEVTTLIGECSSPSGYPVIVKFTNDNNQSDSFITTSLSTTIRFIGSKFSFKIASQIPDKEIMVCTSIYVPPIQKSIYDIK